MKNVEGHTFYKGVTHLNRQEIAERHSKYQPFLDHLCSVVETLNRAFDEWGIPVRVAADMMSDTFLRGRDAVNRFISGESDGVLHPPQLETFVEALAAILSAPTMNIAVNGVTQCGKTGTSNAMYFLGPILYLLNKERYATVMLTINRQSSYDQTKTEFERFLDLYEFLRFYHRDGETIVVDGEEFYDLSYSAYWQTVIKGVLPRELGLHRTTDQIRTRSPGKVQMEEIKRLLDLAKDEKIVLALLVDETHFGSEVGGTQAAIFEHILPELKSTTSKNIFIGFSATNWELCNLPNVAQVYHRLGPDYCGFNLFNGQLVDPRVTVKPLRYHGVTDFQKRFGFTRLEEVRNNCYDDAKAFTNNRVLAKLHRGSWNYQRFVEEMFADLIHWALGVAPPKGYYHNQPIEPNPQHGKGLAVRFSRNNQRADAFIGELRKLLDPTIDIIRYFGGGNSVRVKEAIERRPNRTGPYVVVMTAAGRLADAFPASCTYFIDLTHQTQNYTALMQGSVGRATGYGKNSLVVLSDGNASALTRYVTSQGSAEAGKVSPRVVQARGLGRPHVAIHLIRDLIADAMLLAKFAELETELRKVCYKFKRGDTWPIGRKGFLGRPCRIWDIFDEATLDYIEDNAASLLDKLDNNAFHLLRPGRPVLGHMYELRKGVGVPGLRAARGHREMTRDAGGGREAGFDDRTKMFEKHGITVHRPQVHYDPNDGTVLALTLRCQKGFYRRQNTGVTKPLPNSRSHMKEFAEGEALQLIEAAESAAK
jgi:hypothetical protein